MFNILIVRSIFCPDLTHLHICASNLVNLFIKLKFQKPDKHIFTLYLCGWIKKQYINDLKKIIEVYEEKSLFKNIILDFWALNYGKFKILNNIIGKCESYDRIFYSDHDIVFKHQTDILFTLLENILNYEVNNFKVGMVMLNQSEDIRHQCDIYENIIKYKSNEYIYPNLGNLTSIASGCFYTSCQVFKLLGKFKLTTVYGLDDYYIMKELYKNTLMAVVLKDYPVSHPFNNCDKYNEWKIENIKKGINKLFGSNSETNNYYLEIEKSMNIWV